MENHYFALIKKTWRYAAGRRKHLVLTYVLFFFANLTFMLEPLVLGLFFNRVQEGGAGVFRDSFFLLLLLASLTLIFWIFHGIGRLIERTNTFYISQNFNNHLFHVLSSFPLKWHKNHHSGNLMSRIQKATSALQGFADEGFMYIETFINFFLALGAIFLLMPLGGAVSLGFGIFVMLIIFRFDRVLIPNYRTINEKRHSFEETFYDYIANIKTVLTLRLEKLAKKEIFRKFNLIFPIWKRGAVINEGKWFFISIVLAVMNVFILSYFLWDKLDGGEIILIGTFVALYQYAQRFRNVFFDLAWKYEQLVRYNTDIKSIESIENAYEKMITDIKKISAPEKFQKIEIKNLYFRYEDESHKKHTLENINLEFSKGEKIALIGESGGGKSTMMTLLRGLEDSSRVTVSIDKKNYDTLKVLGNYVTLIPQDPEIFENTIEYNICFGIRHNEKEILYAAELACFKDILKKLPKGLKTNIKEKGVNLSGGEKQRLALARGIFAAENSSIILLDEPTSSVDTRNETKIYDNLFSHFANRTIISSIHRLHLLPKFDRIYLFSEGKMTDFGSFEELLQKSLLFKKMWETYSQTLKKK